MSAVFVLLDGWAIRYRSLPDGRRQILNVMLPGDLFDLQALADLRADHSVMTCTSVEVMSMPPKIFLEALQQARLLSIAFWWAMVQEESILREQIVRVGRRNAKERIGHFLLELQRRMSVAMGVEVVEFMVPLKRADIADALGLTPVHVSRTFGRLKEDGLISEENGSIRLLDTARLAKICHFDTDYLHLKALPIDGANTKVPQLT